MPIPAGPNAILLDPHGTYVPTLPSADLSRRTDAPTVATDSGNLQRRSLKGGVDLAENFIGPLDKVTSIQRELTGAIDDFKNELGLDRQVPALRRVVDVSDALSGASFTNWVKAKGRARNAQAKFDKLWFFQRPFARVDRDAADRRFGTAYASFLRNEEDFYRLNNKLEKVLESERTVPAKPGSI